MRVYKDSEFRSNAVLELNLKYAFKGKKKAKGLTKILLKLNFNRFQILKNLY